MKIHGPLYDSRKAELRAQIRQVFPLKPVPRDDEIVTSTFHLDLERDAIKKFLRGKSWEMLTFDTLVHKYRGDDSAILAFSSEIGFLYYFPAFLMLTLNEFATSEWMNAYSSIYAFTHYWHKTKMRQPHEIVRINQFSDQQLKVTREVFEFVKLEDAHDVAADEIQKAIEVVNYLLISREARSST